MGMWFSNLHIRKHEMTTAEALTIQYLYFNAK